MARRFRSILDAERAASQFASSRPRNIVAQFDSNMATRGARLGDQARVCQEAVRAGRVPPWTEELTAAQRNFTSELAAVRRSIAELDTAIGRGNTLANDLRVYERTVQPGVANVRAGMDANRAAAATNLVEQQVAALQAERIALQTRVELVSDEYRLLEVLESRAGWPVQRLEQVTAEIAEAAARRAAREFVIEVAGRRLVATVTGAVAGAASVIFEAAMLADLVDSGIEMLEALTPDPQRQRAYSDGIRQHIAGLNRTLDPGAIARMARESDDGAVWSRAEILLIRTPRIGDGPPGPWRLDQVYDLGITGNHDARDPVIGPHGGAIVYLPLNDAAQDAEQDATARGPARPGEEPNARPIIDRPGGVPDTDNWNTPDRDFPAPDMVITAEEAGIAASTFDLPAPDMVITPEEAGMGGESTEVPPADMVITLAEALTYERSDGHGREEPDAPESQVDSEKLYAPALEDREPPDVPSSPESDTIVTPEQEGISSPNPPDADMVITPEEAGTDTPEFPEPDMVITPDEAGISTQQFPEPDMVITPAEAGIDTAEPPAANTAPQGGYDPATSSATAFSSTGDRTWGPDATPHSGPHALHSQGPGWFSQDSQQPGSAPIEHNNNVPGGADFPEPSAGSTNQQSGGTGMDFPQPDMVITQQEAAADYVAPDPASDYSESTSH